jgi:hypothetical protein
MKQYEYKEIYADRNSMNYLDKQLDELNKAGREGWELTGTIADHDIVVCLMKRELKQSKQPSKGQEDKAAQLKREHGARQTKTRYSSMVKTIGNDRQQYLTTKGNYKHPPTMPKLKSVNLHTTQSPLSHQLSTYGGGVGK